MRDLGKALKEQLDYYMEQLNEDMETTPLDCLIFYAKHLADTLEFIKHWKEEKIEYDKKVERIKTKYPYPDIDIDWKEDKIWSVDEFDPIP